MTAVLQAPVLRHAAAGGHTATAGHGQRTAVVTKTRINWFTQQLKLFHHPSQSRFPSYMTRYSTDSVNVRRAGVCGHTRLKTLKMCGTWLGVIRP